MEPVEVDVVGLQAAQGMLAGRDDRLAPGTAAVGIAGVEAAAEFRGDDQPLAAARVATDMVSYDLFRMALGVEVRGVEEVAAELDVAIQDLFRFIVSVAPQLAAAAGRKVMVRGLALLSEAYGARLARLSAAEQVQFAGLLGKLG
jgi:hypothetical protein